MQIQVPPQICAVAYCATRRDGLIGQRWFVFAPRAGWGGHQRFWKLASDGALQI